MAAIISRRQNFEESIIMMRESCSSVGNTSTGTLATGVQERSRCVVRHANRWRRRRNFGASNILLIITWEFIVRCSLGLTMHKLQYFAPNLEKEEEDGSVSLWMVKGDTLLGIATLSISCPIASLLAEVVIGRYKLVSYSLKAMWLLSIICCVLSVCQESLPVNNTTLYKIQLDVLVIPQYLILGAFLVSAVPLALDQITGGLNTNISAFILWFNWAFFSGLAAPRIVGSLLYDCTYLQPSKASTIMSLLPVLLLSVGLILDFHFHHKLVKEPVTVNPVSLIFKVLKYAAKHKYPVQRSAFTYCENERPTRLDHGKSKYGGPFTTEQVEDVKTFWRVLVVILALSTLHLSLMAVVRSESVMSDDFGSLKTKNQCIQASSHNIISPSFTMVYSIPLYELLIYPCLRNRGPSIRQSAGIGAAALVFASVYGCVAETMRQTFTNNTTECMFEEVDPDESKLNFLIAIPFIFALGFISVVLNKSSLEFVCAQAPYNMTGLLIGFFFALQTVFITLGTVWYETWKNNWFDIFHTSTCGIWFYLSTLVLAVVSSALLGLVIRWYKARERDEITRSQDLVEEVYHKYHEQTP